MTNTIEKHWMEVALKEARLGWGTTRPNPMVGAVITTQSGELIAAGHHEYAGGPHAEINALRKAGEKARGGILYVTLEPCSTFGRTPPCTSAIIEAGIRRVVIGCTDANPLHEGAGIDLLRKQGIDVVTGILETECLRLNLPFFWWICNKRPYVFLKMAESLDGKIALKNGDSKWISGKKSRDIVQKLRQLSDMVMIGGETARLDRPELIVRQPKNWPHQPDVAIWTNRPVPDTLPLFAPGGIKRRIVFAKPQSQDEWLHFLEEEGKNGCQVLLIEGGGELAASALQAGIVNRLFFFIAPKIIGGRDSRPSVSGNGISSLSQAIRLTDTRIRRIGEDFLYEATPVLP